MSKLYKNTPRLSLEDPDKHVERPLHDDARRDAATTAVPVSRKATDTHIERGEAGASQGVEDAQKWQSHRDAYHRSNDEATKLKDRELSGHFESWLGRIVGSDGLEKLKDMVAEKGLAFDPHLVKLLRTVGGAAQNAHVARAMEAGAGRTPPPATPSGAKATHVNPRPVTTPGHKTGSSMYAGTAKAPAPARTASPASKATRLYGKGSR
jgi:hypothetical protein